MQAFSSTQYPTYVIPGTPGGFTARNFVDFSSATAGDFSAAQTLLSSHKFNISNYPVKDKKHLDRIFDKRNVSLGTGTLDLKVSAYTSGAVRVAGILTQDTYTYSSVRVVLKSSTTAGVCQGIFYYLNDNQEVDWEILTSTTQTDSRYVPAGIWATNQATDAKAKKTYSVIPIDFDPAGDFHEYRIDWIPGTTIFYLDGVQKAYFKTNVPTMATHLVVNAWSNGDPHWSNGPPSSDSITHIRSIDLYTKYTDSATGYICNI